MTPSQQETVRFEVLKAIEANPTASQRELSRELGVSLGSVNYCLKSLIERGMVKVDNFVRSDKKRGYAYHLTPHGVVKKAEITAQFLQRKMTEYELIKKEISELKQALGRDDNNR